VDQQHDNGNSKQVLQKNSSQVAPLDLLDFRFLDTKNQKNIQKENIQKQLKTRAARRSSLISLESTNQLNRKLNQITIGELGNCFIGKSTSPSQFQFNEPNGPVESFVADQPKQNLSQALKSDVSKFNKLSARRMTVDYKSLKPMLPIILENQKKINHYNEEVDDGVASIQASSMKTQTDKSSMTGKQSSVSEIMESKASKTSKKSKAKS